MSHRGTQGTRAAVLERYHTAMRRDAAREASGRGLIRRALARNLDPWLPDDRDAPMLDIGCGEGVLLGLLRDRGYRRLAGFDLSPENVALCHADGLDVVAMHDATDLASFAPGARYRVVFLIDVVEHLPKEDAVPVLRAVRARLEPGGTVIVRTPNLGSLLGALERYGDLTHEWGLTERSAVDLMRAAGFAAGDIDVAAAWGATTALGRIRERYLRVLHRTVFLSAGRARPRICTPNLLIRGVAR